MLDVSLQLMQHAKHNRLRASSHLRIETSLRFEIEVSAKSESTCAVAEQEVRQNTAMIMGVSPQSLSLAPGQPPWPTAHNLVGLASLTVFYSCAEPFDVMPILQRLDQLEAEVALLRAERENPGRTDCIRCYENKAQLHIQRTAFPPLWCPTRCQRLFSDGPATQPKAAAKMAGSYAVCGSKIATRRLP